MNTRELIENSLLDAMGLLDERETQAFERAFRTASPAVQAHVRREQTRLSHIEQLLPQVEPPAELRAAVIEAVRIEMDLAAEQAANGVRSPIFTLLPSQRVSAMWRAAAIGFMTAAVVFGTTTITTRRIFDNLENLMNERQFAADWWFTADRGLAEKYFYNDSTRFVSFSKSTATATSKAFIAIQAESDLALFHCRSLPPQLMDVMCELVEIDAEGNAKQRARFTYTGDVIMIEVTVELNTENRFTIRELTVGTPSDDDMQFSTLSVGEINDLSLFG